MVAAAPVRRGSDVFDVVLQPLAETGTTNMVLWLGDITTIWNLEIGPGPRTADVVFVITPPRTAQTAPPAAARNPREAPAAAGARAGATATPAPPPRSNASNAPGPSGAATPIPTPSGEPAAGPAPALELRQTVGLVKSVFRAFRTKNGILLHYEINNGTDADLLIKPSAILVRADRRPVAYAMARDSVDRGRPDVIPRGGTETGVIEIATPSARQIELALPLLPLPSTAAPAAPPSAPQAGSETPAARAGTAPSVSLPIVLQATFVGLDRLPVTAAP